VLKAIPWHELQKLITKKKNIYEWRRQLGLRPPSTIEIDERQQSQWEPACIIKNISRSHSSYVACCPSAQRAWCQHIYCLLVWPQFSELIQTSESCVWWLVKRKYHAKIIMKLSSEHELNYNWSLQVSESPSSHIIHTSTKDFCCHLIADKSTKFCAAALTTGGN
jgi:hypothetical protein